MKLNLNDQIKALLLQAAKDDMATNGEMKALSHYANVAIAEYFKQQTIHKKDAHADKQSKH